MIEAHTPSSHWRLQARGRSRFPIVLSILLLAGAIQIEVSEGHIVGGITRDDQGFRFQFTTDPSFPAEGEEVFLVFSIQNATDGFGILDADASVRISREGTLLEEFENLETQSGDFAIPHRFESQGQYTIQIQLDNVEGTPSTLFPLEIIASSGFEAFTLVIIVSLGAVFLAVVINRLRSKKRVQPVQD